MSFVIPSRLGCVAAAASGMALAAFVAFTAPSSAIDLPRGWFGKKLPPEPAAAPSTDALVPPPGEDQYFPIRADGQPYLLDIDNTVNLTDALNRFYFDPKWRGEIWTPYKDYTIVERAARMMSTWPDYDQMNLYHRGNHVSKFLEKWSGYGP